MTGEQTPMREVRKTIVSGAAFLVGVIAVESAVIGVSNAIDGHDSPFARPTRTVANKQTCIDPTRADFVMVDILLRANELDNKGKNVDLDSSKIAHKLGVTVHPETVPESLIYAAVDSDDNILDPEPFSYFYNMAKKRLQLYGVDLEIPKTPAVVVDGKPVQHSDLENRDSKLAMINLAYAYTNVPEQLVEYAGLKKIIITDLPKGLDGEFASKKPDRYFIDESVSRLDVEAYMHELYHMVDYRQCGDDFYKDKAFKALSPAGLYNKKGPAVPNYVSSMENSGLCSEVATAKYAKLTARYNKLAHKAKVIGSKIAIYDDYAKTNVPEDKAVTGAEVLDPETYGVFRDNRYPILDSKFRFLLARLFHTAPSTAKFLIDSSNYYDQELC